MLVRCVTDSGTDAPRDWRAASVRGTDVLLWPEELQQDSGQTC